MGWFKDTVSLKRWLRPNYSCNLGKFFAERAQLRRLVKGQHATSSDPKQAQRRRWRREEQLHVAKCAIENPSGSKLLRRFARAAGFAVSKKEDGKEVVRQPSYKECRDWHAGLLEAQERQGHQGFRIVRQTGSPLTMS